MLASNAGLHAIPGSLASSSTSSGDQASIELYGCPYCSIGRRNLLGRTTVESTRILCDPREDGQRRGEAVVRFSEADFTHVKPEDQRKMRF